MTGEEILVLGWKDEANEDHGEVIRAARAAKTEMTRPPARSTTADMAKKTRIRILMFSGRFGSSKTLRDGECL